MCSGLALATVVLTPSDWSDDCLFSNTPLSWRGDSDHTPHHFRLNQIDKNHNQ